MFDWKKKLQDKVWNGGNKKERKTHHRLTHEHRKAAVAGVWWGCSCKCGSSLGSNNLIEKLNGEIFYVWGERNFNERNSPLCRQDKGKYDSNRPVIPLLTEGGWPARPNKEQFWKIETVKKIRMVGEK